MSILVTDPELAARLKAERRKSGGDRYDEVWDGVYVMSPMADDEHQDLALTLGAAFLDAIGRPGLGLVRAGVNVSDRVKGWKRNYRVPDVAVFLKGTTARNCGAHWCGGPDFAVEILSRGDRAREKLDFYARVGVRELLLIDRDPWSLELYRLRDGQLVHVGIVEEDPHEPLRSEVLPLSFRLTPGEGRPRVEVSHRDGDPRWSA